ncbi:ATP-grasp domain-containing protein [Microbacterium sp. M28]|uniref:acetyl/propionyl/methylcrotonyl-CoA carboxylase subunit alpha n=1 Tax=Microbacterium sp. M28 TaxID=2962064 RepID=UPI0021F44A82|nr:biotin carboxylase N-terminal domain-containing protein [Microbacterium sp. M28]UYO95667.1 ATP-grasp domain-containing protein [Microbacterium sp. M28]
MPVYSSVLIANRGEIARRIIRTLRTLGIRSIAVYSDADAEAPHVREADDAVWIGPSPASDSYLRIDAIIDAAHESGAEAIHPGYGFLSESVELARACAQAGLVFIGPGVEALEIMGDKARSRAHVSDRGVPVVPGFDASGLSDAEIAGRAAQVGYPLLVKPSAGGGGKGMEIVREAAGLAQALSSARRVAAASFGDDALVLERLIGRPRHIEVQVFGDMHGTVVAVGERECTLQRRHQKVIEEAPAPGIADVVRERLWSEAVRVAASVDYVGAGTVEFLIDADAADEVFFIEMNTRLQVEHPVTEAVTGLDLVELQLRVAAGEALPEIPRAQGHAFEARVYAESPERGFLPSTGTVLRFTAPRAVRVDAAIETGSEISGFYDPMIAKVIARGADRAAALERLDAALARTVVLGVETNIAFLRALCADSRVAAADLDTGLIETLLPFEAPSPSTTMLDAARNHVQREKPARHAFLGQQVVSRAGSAWSALPGWRLSGTDAADSSPAFLTDDGDVLRAPASSSSDERSEESKRVRVDAALAPDGAVWVSELGRTATLRPLTRRQLMERRLAARHPETAATHPEARASMPGSVVAVHVADGARVQAGEPIVSIEAMKMEHPVLAPHDGTVHLLVAQGDQVRRDQPVARVEAEESHD